LGERTETRSGNARHVILKCEEKLYYVSMISVCFSEGEATHKATFHAREIVGNQFCDLDFEIPQKLYDILMEYTKLDNSDLMLVLSVENKEFKWSLMSENWLRHYSNLNNANNFIV